MHSSLAEAKGGQLDEMAVDFWGAPGWIVEVAVEDPLPIDLLGQ